MSAVPYLGSKISLISKSEIRYEGILYTLDAKESTIALAKVKSFGTEGRPSDRPVAPRDEIYDYIIFRASDIKDLHICEAPKAHTLPHDPAIIQHSQPVSQYSSLSLTQPFSALYGLPAFQHFQSQPSYPPIPPILTSNHYAGSARSTAIPSHRKSPTSDAGVQVSVGNMNYAERPRETREPLKPHNREMNQNFQTNRRRMPANRPQQQINRRNMSRRGRGRPGNRAPTIEKFENEYDFEQANAEFQELENKLSKSIMDEASNEGQSSPELAPNAYDKEKSFFDEISCEATRSAGFPRFDWRYERKLNIETFGVSANNAWLRRRRGRGGFRRGFRGRGGMNRSTESSIPQKTVTFDETPAIKEVEVINLEAKSEQMPVIEVITEEKKGDWPEPSAAEPESVWD